MSKILRITFVIVVVIAAGVALKLTLFAPEVVEVRTATVDRGPVEQTVTNTRAGTVKVRLRARLSPQIGGMVTSLPHREGETVETGDLLLTLDSRIQEASLRLADRTVALSLATAEEICLGEDLAAKELARSAALHKKGFASEQIVDTLSTERDRTHAACIAARTTVEQARASRTLASVQLQLTELRAPFNGIVADVTTEVGEWITPSPPGVPIPPVIDLLDPASIYISAPIDEVDAERIHVGQEVRITIDSRRGEVFPATVARVAPFVLDTLEQNRTVEVEVVFSDVTSLEGVLPGTSADVDIILERRANVLRAPAAAVAEGGGVLVLANGVLEERTATIGLKNWQFAEVVAGLDEGSKVVISRSSTDIKAGVQAVDRDHTQ